MKTQKKTKEICISLLSAFLLITFVISPSFSSFAIDNTYVDNIYSWDDVTDLESVSQNDFNAVVKYVFDKQSACFYINVFYDYSKAENVDLSDIYLGVRIKNSFSNYDFKICNNGLVYANTSDIEKNLNFTFRYVDCNKKRGTGKIVIAVELKDKNDKLQNNYIDCYFSVNDEESILLIDNFEFNLLPPETTVKPTTVKQTTTKRESAVTTVKAKANTSSARTTKEVTTKFSPSSRKYTTSHKATTKALKKSTTTKFTPSQSDTTEIISSCDVTETTTDFFDYSFTDESYITLSDKPKAVMSTQAKAVVVTAIIIAIVGASLIAIAVVGGKYKLVKAESISDNKEDSDD